MKSSILCLVILILIVLGSCSEGSITCTMKGNISGRGSDTLILAKATEDLRFADTFIPIADSAFSYKLVLAQPEAYQLVFLDEFSQGVWKPIIFFPENCVVTFKLFNNSDFGKNQIEGGRLNKIYNDYLKNFEATFRPEAQPLEDSLTALYQRNQYYSPEMSSLVREMQITGDPENLKKIREKIDSLKSQGKDLSPAALEISNKNMLLFQSAMEWRYNYIRNNPSIVSYYFLVEDMLGIDYNMVKLNDIKDAYSVLSKKFPSHPYTPLIRTLIDARDTVKVGGRFIDFEAPDLNNKYFKLSDLIKDKIALIDLWASWCGPCITTSRSMIPVYEEFKDKGFTICGVAAEIDNTRQLSKTLEKEKFPWINLVDLNRKSNIWNKYGIPNAGGGTFLVDQNGIIMAINPTAEQVRTILKERLK